MLKIPLGPQTFVFLCLTGIRAQGIAEKGDRVWARAWGFMRVDEGHEARRSFAKVMSLISLSLFISSSLTFFLFYMLSLSPCSTRLNLFCILGSWVR